jgi:hypothetical protein
MMKIWMIVAIVGLLALAGLTVVDALSDAQEEAAVESRPSCGGGCNAQKTCGNPGCSLRDGSGNPEGKGQGGCGCSRS